ncbi:unnamed protein product [Symbiodinium sp. CCMP2456]|nr:unnamed protein product [Symbiodinium sp. CCMP2456]
MTSAWESDVVECKLCDHCEYRAERGKATCCDKCNASHDSGVAGHEAHCPRLSREVLQQCRWEHFRCDLGAEEEAICLVVPPRAPIEGPAPVLLFLTGNGHVDDRQDFLSGGVDQLIRNGDLQKYVLLAPKPLWKTGVLRHNDSWRNAWCEDAVWALVTEMLRRLGPANVDPTRLYATGLSLGAIGVWHLALRYGEYLAGIVPVSGRCEWPFNSWPKTGGVDQAVAKRLENIPLRCYQIDADRYGGTPVHDLEWLCWGLPETSREVTLRGMEPDRQVEVKIRSWERPSGKHWDLWEAKGPLKDWAYYDDWGGDKHCLWNRVYPFPEWGLPSFLASHAVPHDRCWKLDMPIPVVDSSKVEDSMEVDQVESRPEPPCKMSTGDMEVMEEQVQLRHEESEIVQAIGSNGQAVAVSRMFITGRVLEEWGGSDAFAAKFVFQAAFASSCRCATVMELLPASLPEQRPRSFGGEDFPLVLSPSRQSSARELSAWAASRSAELQKLLLQHGAVLFRDCGITSAEDFGLVVRAMGCEGYDYVGGAAPRTEVVKGVVFTSNESPPDQPIPFHHELAQSPTPPNYILFCCEVESKHGGATPIIPSDEVADFFMSHFPDFAREVEAKGVRYIRTMPEVTDPTSAQGRSWAESYAVKTREEAEEVMTKQGSTWEWLSGGDLKVTTAALPALRMDERTGRRVFFNSVIAAFTGWNDSRNVGEEAVLLGDFSPVNKHALRAVARFMAEREVAFAWKKGDILIVDNGSVLHSRQSFEPPRRVLAALRGKPLLGPALRAGIIGTGAMGKEHIRNVALMGEQMVVTAIADSSEAALREALEELGGERAPRVAVFRSDEELINCDFVDVLIICTPNFQHIHTLRKAIMSGKHILCEKPLCTTVEDCEEVERLLTERVVRSGSEKAPVFMTGMEYRYMPPIRRLIEESDSRKLGEPRVLSIREHRFPFLVKVDNWNRFNRNTGGTLVEKACHFFDLMRRILQSEPVSVYASGDQAMNHKDEVYDGGIPDIIDHALAVVEFANGARASLDLCMFAEDEQTEQVRVVCQQGSVEAKCPESTVRIVQRRKVRGLGRTPPGKEERAVPEVIRIPISRELAAAGYHEGATFFELEAFAEAVRGKRAVPVTARDGKMAVLMGVAAHRSIALGRPVRLSPAGQIIEEPSADPPPPLLKQQVWSRL